MLKKIISLIIFILFFFLNENLLAKEAQELPEIIVTANKIVEPLGEITSEVVVLTEKDLQKMNVDWVIDALRKLPDLYVKQLGGIGKQASVFLETSTKSGDILVMIDGIKVNSPTTGDFDFSSLSVNEIERIEIIKGPQSTLYGSEAMSGVINIITKKGKGKPKIDLSLYGGSYGTYKPAFNFSGGTKELDYRITTYYFKTDGFSAYAKGKEDDGYKQAFFSGKFGFRPSEKLEFEFMGRYFYDRSELDFGIDENLSPCKDDKNYVQKRHHSLISGKVKIDFTSNWEQILTFSKVKEIYNTKDPDDLFRWYSSKITPEIYLFDWQNNLSFFKKIFLTFGAEYRKEEGKYESSLSYDKDVENTAIYLNTKLKLWENKVILNGGIRYDNHQTFGEKITYKIGALYTLTSYGLRLKANYGTAFKAPTLNALFWPNTGWSMGNPNLKPEESWAWNIGFEKDFNFFNTPTTFSFSSFYQKYKNLINWVEIAPWFYKPQNIDKASIKGFEAHLNLNITSNLNLTAGYTYLDTEDKKTKKYLVYKPFHKFSVIGEYSLGKFSFLADYTYTGKRYADKENKRDLKAYSLVNLSATYRLNPNLNFFARIDNLLDTNYEEVKDYGTPDFSFYLGIRFSY